MGEWLKDDNMWKDHQRLSPCCHYINMVGFLSESDKYLATAVLTVKSNKMSNSDKETILEKYCYTASKLLNKKYSGTFSKHFIQQNGSME